MNAKFKNIFMAGSLGVIVWLCVLFLIFTGVTIIIWLIIGLVLFGLCHLWNKYAQPTIGPGEEDKKSDIMEGRGQ